MKHCGILWHISLKYGTYLSLLMINCILHVKIQLEQINACDNRKQTTKILIKRCSLMDLYI